MLSHFKFLMPIYILCASNSLAAQSSDSTTDADTEAEKVYMSFSGGGYHAHAGASSVMMSLMDRVRANAAPDAHIGMHDITQNVAALSSNSGGSWFLTQAAYTDIFRTALDAKDGWRNYTASDGYFGQAYAYISSHHGNSAICDPLLPFYKDDYKKCVQAIESADSYTKFLLSGGDANWHKLAVNAVFGAKFNDPSWRAMAVEANKPISSERQDWAKDKPLIFASSLLSSEPALNHSMDWLQIRSLRASQGGDIVPGAAPVAFSALATEGSSIGPLFLLGGDTVLEYGTVSTLEGKFKPDSGLEKKTLPKDTVFDKATVIDVAASSSAAGAGFIDIPNMQASGLPAALAALLDNFAPAFTFDSDARYHGPYDGLTLEDLAQKNATRLADGGFADNTAVAYMLSYLANSKQLRDGFNILSMDNYPQQPMTYDDGSKPFPTGPDVASLFGYPDPSKTTRTSKLFGKFSYTGIVPHVFVNDPYFTMEGGKPHIKQGAKWCAWIEPAGEKNDTCVTIMPTASSSQADDEPCDMYLSYVHYKVTVKENAYFGIGPEHAGVTGNLYVFSNLGSNPGVVPDSDFQAGCYSKLVEAVHTTVTGDNDFGNTLASLLGL